MTGVGLPGHLNFSARRHYHKNRRKIGGLETGYLPISSGKWGHISDHTGRGCGVTPGYLNFSARRHHYKNRRKIGGLEMGYLPISSGKWGHISDHTRDGCGVTRLFKF